MINEMGGIPWDELLYYDKSSPSILRNKITRNPRVVKDNVAGALHKKTGYYRIGYNNKVYMVHRIVWSIFFGPLRTNEFIDHIDGDTTNNRITNLRKVDLQLNSKNSKKRKSNTTGVTNRDTLHRAST